ncbi:hypothetical protein AUK22_00735 [bacterium CG2_30_54_10]|nr:MAG: hypothetical protein AUK22_00735 [bacterium CG2_30_54_10]
MLVILIADDSATARMIVQRCVEMVCSSQATFLEASNGQIALEMVRNAHIDLLITDLNMPCMNGKELLRSIKASPRMNHIPVVVISSQANPALELELTEIGADKVLHKPISPELLKKAFDFLTAKDAFHDS